MKLFFRESCGTVPVSQQIKPVRYWQCLGISLGQEGRDGRNVTLVALSAC